MEGLRMEGWRDGEKREGKELAEGGGSERAREIYAREGGR